MIFSAKYLVDYNKMQPHLLYQIDEKNSKITFREEQSKHIVNIIYNLKNDEYGYFGNEFRPNYISKKCPDIGKAVDLLCIIIDENLNKTSTYLYDIKETFEGVDVIEKGLKQIQASINHADSLLAYFKQFDNQKKIGIITGSFDENRIQRYIDRQKAVLEQAEKEEKLMPPMVVYKFKTQNVEIEKKIEMMENVLKRKVEILGENYELDIRISNKEDDTYIYDLDICLL